MECKDDNYYLAGPAGEYWNISRMECKEKIGERLFILQRIGIYPEWNVKKRPYVLSRHRSTIGIYPEWNVKMSRRYKQNDFITDWNISRMECKVDVQWTRT